MVLLPTGSETKILEVKTTKAHVIIKSKKSQPFFRHEHSIEHDSTIIFFGDEIEEIRLKDCNNITPLDTNNNYCIGYNTIPLFFEQHDYEIIIKGAGDAKIGFWHENYHIRNKVDPISDNDNILTGVINFDNNIGYSELVITVDGKRHLAIRIEVFPTKISYKDDYKNIIRDITNEINAIVFDFLRKTYETVKLGDRIYYTPAVFFTIIRSIFNDFIKSADIIIKFPHHALVTDHEILPAHKVRKTNSKSARWLEKHPEHVNICCNRVHADRTVAVKKHITYDTIENRFTKLILTSTIKRLEDFRKRYAAIDDAEISIINETTWMIKEVNRRVYYSFLKNVNDYQATQSMSLAFSMAPGYRNLYKHYLMLSKGLTVNGDIFRMSTKDIALLYEYWCFLKLNSILKKSCKLVSLDIIKINHSGITVTLTKGKKSEIKYIYPLTGEKISLTYNPGELNTQTISQKPDNVLTLEKTGSDIPYKYIFDAKYRIDPAIPGTGYPDVKPGPKIDDINAMHRYRDSIVFENDTPSRYAFEKSMFGAYVLFPYADEKEYINHKFYKSIETVNIGGLPFLPGATSLVEKLLTELIMDSKESAFERTLLPRGIEKMLVKVDWSIRDVLVGSLRNVKQLKYNLEKKFYHVPTYQLRENNFPIRYVALYQSKEIFGNKSGIRYYGEVSKVHICKRKNIPIPLTHNNPEEPYYRFDIKSWKTLPVTIKVREEGVNDPKFTNLFLLQNCRDTYELFTIHSEEQYRLLQELKRISNDTSVNNDEQNPGFRLNNGVTVNLVNGDIIACSPEGKIISKTPIAEFKKRPRYVFNKLKEDMKIEQVKKAASASNEAIG